MSDERTFQYQLEEWLDRRRIFLAETSAGVLALSSLFGSVLLLWRRPGHAAKPWEMWKLVFKPWVVVGVVLNFGAFLRRGTRVLAQVTAGWVALSISNATTCSLVSGGSDQAGIVLSGISQLVHGLTLVQFLGLSRFRLHGDAFRLAFSFPASVHFTAQALLTFLAPALTFLPVCIVRLVVVAVYGVVLGSLPLNLKSVRWEDWEHIEITMPVLVDAKERGRPGVLRWRGSVKGGLSVDIGATRSVKIVQITDPHIGAEEALVSWLFVWDMFRLIFRII